MLKIQNVSKSYGKTDALKNVSTEISRGEIVGLFGANGAGKTTLLKSVLNFIKFDGKISLDGKEISRDNIEKISFATAEHSFFENLNAKEHFEFYKAHFDTFREIRFNKLMEFFELPLNKKIKSFSLGQKNQFEVILALSQGADYILMDEPFAGNDIFNREDFYKVLLGILQENETIILSTHLIEEVSNFIDRVLILDKGELLKDAKIADIEAEGISLMKFIKDALSYRADRVSKMINELENED